MDRRQRAGGSLTSEFWPLTRQPLPRVGPREYAGIPKVFSRLAAEPPSRLAEVTWKRTTEDTEDTEGAGTVGREGVLESTESIAS
ncbi:MAG: hypothetical protein Kow0054_17700 [Deferrisoma sp.]